jgi:hypothetical protein
MFLGEKMLYLAIFMGNFVALLGRFLRYLCAILVCFMVFFRPVLFDCIQYLYNRAEVDFRLKMGCFYSFLVA